MLNLKLINIFQSCLIFILWSLVPVLISYFGWQLFLPSPITSIEVDEPNTTSLNHKIEQAGWFSNKKTKPEVIESPKPTKINNNYRLLGIFLPNNLPAMALVIPNSGGSSQMIVEGKKSKLEINLIRAINPFEIEVEDNQGNISILKINKQKSSKNLFKQGNHKTQFTNFNPIPANSTLISPDQSKSIITNQNQIIPTAPNVKNQNNINTLDGEINAFLSSSSGFAQLSQDKQAEIRQLLKIPNYLQKMKSDRELFEGLMKSYQQLN